MEETQEQPNELNTLKLENQNLKHELQLKTEAITGLEKTVGEKDREISVIKQVAEDFKEKYDRSDKALEAAIKAYLALAAEANPGPVAEMIKGDNIAAIDESVKAARALVEKVKQDVGAENAKVRVPAGAPPRTLPDLSALSAREKIRYGVEKG